MWIIFHFLIVTFICRKIGKISTKYIWTDWSCIKTNKEYRYSYGSFVWFFLFSYFPSSRSYRYLYDSFIDSFLSLSLSSRMSRMALLFFLFWPFVFPCFSLFPFFCLLLSSACCSVLSYFLFSFNRSFSFGSLFLFFHTLFSILWSLFTSKFLRSRLRFLSLLFLCFWLWLAGSRYLFDEGAQGVYVISTSPEKLLDLTFTLYVQKGVTVSPLSFWWYFFLCQTQYLSLFISVFSLLLCFFLFSLVLVPFLSSHPLRNLCSLFYGLLLTFFIPFPSSFISFFPSASDFFIKDGFLNQMRYCFVTETQRLKKSI